ncbi:MAG: hypothetical protein KAV00_00860 [Phycisphaerae bacterium]|nr:hypothetical protein [Phycisphaerae bacterium]
MAKAAFFAEELTVTDNGKFLIIEGVRRCPHGHAIEQVFITVPKKLGHLFTEIRNGEESPEVESSRPVTPAVAERLRKYFENN